MDIDEEGLRAGRLSARLYGYARVPFERHLMQNPKAGGSAEDATLDRLCREIAEEMAPRGGLCDRTRHDDPACPPSSWGWRAACWASMPFSTASSSGATSPGPSSPGWCEGRPARIILGIIGGQGYSFGRGNQQIGPEVIRAVGRENIILLASQQKILALGENRLLADTGDPAVDELLRGYIRVRLAPGLSTMMRIDA